jgi:hypothetical protein
MLICESNLCTLNIINNLNNFDIFIQIHIYYIKLRDD